MNRHPLWGRNPETFGEDPHLTATMGEAFTQQLQQPNRSSRFDRTTSVTRHLVVYSGPESLKADNTQGQDRFSFNANVTDRDLEDYFYPPFEACIDQNRGNSKGAMCSDAAQNGVPSCASELLMTRKDPTRWGSSRFTRTAAIAAERGVWFGSLAWGLFSLCCLLHQLRRDQSPEYLADSLVRLRRTLPLAEKPKDWNASDDFFVVSDMGSYYNVYDRHHYRDNTSDALLTDLKAGLGILYLRSGAACRDNAQTTAVDCPETAGSSQQANETLDALEMVSKIAD